MGSPLIVTGANKLYKHFVPEFIAHCVRLNYDYLLYDLGGLNLGIEFNTNSDLFNRKGYYKIMDESSGWKSRGLHKPGLILDAMTRTNENLAYLDIDAFPVQKFNEVFDEDFDIGVTARGQEEPKGQLGDINAGVIFVKPTALNLVETWNRTTQKIGNDQLALNEIISNSLYKISKFPTSIYNYYYFPRKPGNNVKIYHFKSADETRDCFEKYRIS